MKKESKKMNCMPYREMIDDYVGARLGRDEKASFEDHLRDCPECTQLIRLQKIADRIIDEEKNSSPGFYLTGRIMDRIENSGKNHSSSALERILKPVAITISVAAAIFAGVVIGNISAKPVVKTVPVELTLMNDIALESVNVLSQE